VAPQLYTDALGEADSPAGTYLDMVRYNTTTIVAALGS
jgi:ABC-type Zn uptake system ZnuABC Zn-binding protein ZnuA